MRTISIQRLAVLCLLYPLLNACEDDPDVFIPPEPGEALIYAYPSDGMVDLPLGSKLLLTFPVPLMRLPPRQNVSLTVKFFAAPCVWPQ